MRVERHDHVAGIGSLLVARRRSRCAFTLVELLMSVTITSMVSVVLGALMMAMQTAWEHTQGLETIQSQSRAALDRIQYMIAQAGTYQVSGQPVRIGVGVVERTVSGTQLPDVLVVWSGGRSGGQVEAGLLTRLPVVSEVVFYAADRTDPTRFSEIMLPTNASSLDFAASNFATTVTTLLTSTSAERVLLCDRVRTSLLTGGNLVPNVRFEMFESPTATELSGISPGTSAWNNLKWSGGIVMSDSGLRQATVRIELQLERRVNVPARTTASPTAVPFFGSASYRYVYRP